MPLLRIHPVAIIPPLSCSLNDLTAGNHIHLDSMFPFCSLDAAQCFVESWRPIVSSPACAIPLGAIDDEVAEALEICGGDAIAALRITLIANAFLEARIDELTAQVSTGFARKVRKPKVKKH